MNYLERYLERLIAGDSTLDFERDVSHHLMEQDRDFDYAYFHAYLSGAYSEMLRQLIQSLPYDKEDILEMVKK